MITCYALHVKHMPFLTPMDAQDAGASPPPAAPHRRAVRPPPPRGRRTTVAQLARIVAAATETRVKRQLMHLNVLEATMLRSSIAVLLCGMVFQSGQINETSVWYSLLAALVGFILLGSIALFVGMVAIETRRVCSDECGARRAVTGQALVAKAASISVRGWTANPLRGRGAVLDATWALAPQRLPGSSPPVAVNVPLDPAARGGESKGVVVATGARVAHPRVGALRGSGL